MLLQAVIEQGGIQPGGLNFDAKVRRESVDVADLFIAHIGLSVTALSALNFTGFVRAPGIVFLFVGTYPIPFQPDGPTSISCLDI